MPGSGRPRDKEPTHLVGIKLTDAQHAMLKALGGSPWLQGLLNLELRKQEKSAKE